MQRAQFNRSLPVPLIHQIAVEAAESRISMDTMSELVWSEWFSGWNKKERFKFYSKAPRKRAGRPHLVGGSK